MANPQNNNKSDKKKILISLIVLPIIVFPLLDCILAFILPHLKLGLNIKLDVETWAKFLFDRSALIVSGVLTIFAEGFITWYLIKRYLFGFRKAISDTERADSDIHDNASLMTPQEITDNYGDFSETYEKSEKFRDEKDKEYKLMVKAAKNDYNWNDLSNFEGVVLRAYKKKNELFIDGIKRTNTLCIGTTGTGKTQYLISPTIEANAKSKTKASMIITDLKGELFARHSKMLQEQGYNTIVINLRNPQKSLRFNPLDIIYDTYHEYLDEKAKGSDLAQQLYSDCENYIKDIARIIIKDGEGQNADFQNGAQSLLAALIFGMLEDSSKLGLEFDSEEPFNEESLGKFRDENERNTKIKNAQTARTAAMNDNEDTDESINTYGSNKVMPDVNQIKENVHSERYGYSFSKDMFNIAQISNIVNKQSKHLFDFLEHRRDIITSKVVENASSIIFAKDSEKTLSSYMSTFATNMNRFMDEGIKYITSKSDFDVKDIFQKPSAVFLIIPDESESRYVLASLYIRQIYNYLIKFASNHPVIEEQEILELVKDDEGNTILDKKGFAKTKKITQKVEINKLERPVYFLCDEFANMPEIKEMGKNLSICRSRNVFFVLIVQELAQLENVYGDKQSKVMLGNLPMQIYLGASLLDSVKYFQEMFGKYTIYQRNASINRDTIEDAFNGTTSLQTKDLVTMTELQNIKPGTVYFKELRKNAVRTVLVPHFDKELRAKGFFQDGSISNDIKADNTPIPFYDIMTREKIYNKKLEGENNSILRLKKGTKLYKELEDEIIPETKPEEPLAHEEEKSSELEENKERIVREQQEEKKEQQQTNPSNEEDLIVDGGYVDTTEINIFDNNFEKIEFEEVHSYNYETEDVPSVEENIITDDLMAQMWNDSISNNMNIEVRENDLL